LDFFGRWKALHYAAKRFYAPVLLSIEDAPPMQTVYLTNEHRKPWEGTLTWSLETLDGEDVVFSDNYFDLPAGHSIRISVPVPSGWNEEDVQSALKIRSVYDTYTHGENG